MVVFCASACTWDVSYRSWPCKNALPREVGEKPGPVRSQATIAAINSDIKTRLSCVDTRRRGHHSITSSARTSSNDGTVNPSALAVLRLIASWYFVGACAGRLAAFSPLKMYRIEVLLQNKTSMITASTATIRRRSIPLGFEAALSRTETEAFARACARSESAASETVTSWAGSARKPSRARVLSLPGSP